MIALFSMATDHSEDLPLRIVRFRTSSWAYVPKAIIHVNNPLAALARYFIILLFLLIIPRVYLHDSCDAAIFSNLSKFWTENKSYLKGRLTLKSVKGRLLKPLLRLDTWKPVFAFCIKFYTWQWGLKVNHEHVMLNQPVFYHANDAIPITRENCHSGMTGQEIHDFIYWGAMHCGNFKSHHNFNVYTHAQSVMTLDRKQRICLPETSDKIQGRVQVDEELYGGPSTAYSHPLDMLHSLCREMNVNCDNITSVQSMPEKAWIMSRSPTQRIILSFGGGHRPGLNCIRQSFFAVRAGAKLEDVSRLALAVEAMMRLSGCYKVGSVMKDSKMPTAPHLSINVLVLLILTIFEVCVNKAGFFKVKDQRELRYELVSLLANVSVPGSGDV